MASHAYRTGHSPPPGISVFAGLSGRNATVGFTLDTGTTVSYNVISSQPAVAALAIYSLPTPANLGPAERCANIGKQESFALPSTRSGNVSGVTTLAEIVYRSLLVTFSDGGVACATINVFQPPVPLARVDFVRGVVGTVYFLEESECTIQ